MRKHRSDVTRHNTSTTTRFYAYDFYVSASDLHTTYAQACNRGYVHLPGDVIAP